MPLEQLAMGCMDPAKMKAAADYLHLICEGLLLYTKHKDGKLELVS